MIILKSAYTNIIYFNKYISRKRIRKTAREEREREKRDKMMMGLLPAPEPKFKLSNFMKGIIYSFLFIYLFLYGLIIINYKSLFTNC